MGSDISGLVGGFHFGYNHQINSFVIGVEADVLLSAMEEYQPGGNLTSATSVTGIEDSVDLLASIRGRLGFLPQDDLLLFATGGVAFIQAEHRIWGSRQSSFADFDLDDTGFVIGAGVEWRPENWYSLKIQGMYYFFNDTVDTGGISVGSNTTGDFGELNNAFSITAGISFNLNELGRMFHGR